MKQILSTFQNFYQSQREKYCPEIKAIEELEKITHSEYIRYFGSNGKENAGSPLNIPLTIGYLVFYIFIGFILPVYFLKNESILYIFSCLLMIAPFVFIWMGCGIIIYDHHVRNFIIPIILIIKYKRNISYRNFLYMLNHSFDDYLTSKIDKNIKVDTIIFDNLIKESSDLNIKQKQEIINIKNKDSLGKKTSITLDEFIKMTDRTLKIAGLTDH